MSNNFVPELPDVVQGQLRDEHGGVDDGDRGLAEQFGLP